jgi:hypothetical protein
VVEIETDQPVDRLGQKVEHHIGNPALPSARCTRAAVSQMREQVLDRLAGFIDSHACLRWRLAIERDRIDVQPAGCDDAEIGRITAHCEKSAEPVDLGSVLVLIGIHQKDQRGVLPFIDGADGPED